MMKIILATFTAVFTQYFTSLAQDAAQQWQVEAVRRFPALGVPDSQFNKRFLEMVSALKKSNPQVFGDPQWPLKIADAVALEINPPSPAQNSAREKTMPKIAEALLAGTVRIVTLNADGKPIASGSGFLVAPDIVATNAHVIKGADDAFVIPYGVEKPIAVTKLLKINAKRDVALLRISQPQKSILPLEKPTEPPEIGSPVYVAGSPKGLEGTFSQGIISGFQEEVATKRLFYTISAEITHGSSGGPVVNAQGRVIGVASAGIGEANLNFAIPIGEICNLLEELK